jgi:hypothetical protein
MRPLLVFLLLFLACPVVAQDAAGTAPQPQLGIGFAQAEEGTWFCRHEAFADALSCAQELCAEQAVDQECVPSAWCLPARWSGLMTIRLQDFQAAQVLCGIGSEAALSATLAVLCADNEAATSCDLVRTIDPDGNETLVEGVTFPGGALPLPEAGLPETEAPLADEVSTGEDESPETPAAP